MTKTKIIQHFADKGIFRLMSRKTLLVLFNHYQEFLTSHKLELPEADSDTPIPYEDIAQQLMNLDNDIPDEQELGEKLDDIVMLSEHYDTARMELDGMLNRYSASIAKLDVILEVDEDRAVALVLTESAADELSFILGRMAAIDSKSYKEFPWRLDKKTQGKDSGTSDVNEEEGQQESDIEEDDADVNLYLTVDQESIKAGREEAEKEIAAAFADEQYKSRCRIFMYPSEKEHSIWFVIEHGGRKLRVESFDPQKEEIECMDYYPLTRNVVVMDGKFKVLRIKAVTSWQTILYYKVFSKLLFGANSHFEDSPVFNFSPIITKGMSKALERGDMSASISRVVVKGIHMKELDGGQKIFHRLSSTQDLCDQWQRKYEHTELLNLQMELGVYAPVTGRSDTVSVKLNPKNGLTVSNGKYTSIVREWLRRRGFENGYVPPVLPVCSDEEVQQADDDNVLFWKEVHRAWRMEKMTRNYLYGQFSRKVAEFVDNYLVSDNTPTVADEWYDPNGKLWDVCKIGVGYYYYDSANESPTTTNGKVREDELEIKKLDKKKMVKAIQSAIFKNSKRVANISLSNSGVYNLGENFAKRCLLYLYVSGERNDKAFTYVLRSNKDEAAINGRLVFFSMDTKPPQEYEDMVSTGQLQCYFLGDILSSLKGELQLVDENLDIVQQAQYPEEKGIRQFWPQMPPFKTTFRDVRIFMHARTCRIVYGSMDRTFAYDELQMFRQDDPNKTDINANRKLLRELIQADCYLGNRKQGWKLDSKKSSAYSRLAVALSRFFGIQESFYEATEETAKSKTKEYRLTFGECSEDDD